MDNLNKILIFKRLKKVFKLTQEEVKYIDEYKQDIIVWKIKRKCQKDLYFLNKDKLLSIKEDSVSIKELLRICDGVVFYNVDFYKNLGMLPEIYFGINKMRYSS